MEKPRLRPPTNSPYFTENPGDPYKAWDASITFDYMPKQYITFRWEYDYRQRMCLIAPGREELRRRAETPVIRTFSVSGWKRSAVGGAARRLDVVNPICGRLRMVDVWLLVKF